MAENKTCLVARKSTAKPAMDKWISILRRAKTRINQRISSSHHDKPSHSSDLNLPTVCKMNASICKNKYWKSSNPNRSYEVGKSRLRYRSQHLAIKKIQQYQKTTELVIPKLNFQKTVAQTIKELNCTCEFQAAAMSILHEAAEKYLVRRFETKNMENSQYKY